MIPSNGSLYAAQNDLFFRRKYQQYLRNACHCNEKNEEISVRSYKTSGGQLKYIVLAKKLYSIYTVDCMGGKPSFCEIFCS